jgi:hypothetical protein
MRTVPVLLLACVALAACGEDEEEPAARSGGGSAFADLTVTVDRDGDGGRPERTAAVRCEAPEDSAACRALARVPAMAFVPTPGNVACTQQYGGPETATVKGTLRGEPVDAELSRVNGCEIARWQDASAFLDAAK